MTVLPVAPQSQSAVEAPVCGSKGASVQHPGWAGNHIGFCPFPTDIDDEANATVT